MISLYNKGIHLLEKICKKNKRIFIKFYKKVRFNYTESENTTHLHIFDNTENICYN